MTNMINQRRQFIKSILAIGAYGLTFVSGIFYSSLAHAPWLKDNFKSGSYKDTLDYLFKDAKFIKSHKIRISRLPRVAENGALVPITISSTLENVERIVILVEKNPSPLSAEFYLSSAVKPRVSARLKMAETCKVIVIVQSGDKLYRTAQKVKVTLGGCGA